MAELLLIRTGSALMAADEASRARISRMPIGQAVRAEVKRIRNLAHHRKFFALVEFVADRHPVYDNREKALVAVKVAAGHVDFLPNPETGELVAVPKSIAFDAMDQFAFDDFYERAVQGVLDHIIPQADREEVDLWVDHVARF
jgi:hypothetical protein